MHLLLVLKQDFFLDKVKAFCCLSLASLEVNDKVATNSKNCAKLCEFFSLTLKKGSRT